MCQGFPVYLAQFGDAVPMLSAFSALDMTKAAPCSFGEQIGFCHFY